MKDERRQQWNTGNRAWQAARQETLKRDERYQQLDAKVRNLQQKLHEEKPKRESRQWNEMRESINKAARKRNDHQRKVDDMLKTSDPRWVALFELQSRLRTGDRELRNMVDSYVANGAKSLQREIGDIKREIAAAEREAQAPYAPEFRALHGGMRGYFSGHYNRDLPRYTSSLSGETATSVAALANTDGRNDVEELLEAWSSGQMWRTQVDWDWRITEEVNGSIKNLPLLQKWLERIRGPILTKLPVGTNPKQ